MLKTYLTSGMAVVIAAGAIAAAQTQTPAPAGQTPATTAPADRTATQKSETMKGDTITLVGCLMREQDVPGRKPNVAERAGILEDYILTNAAPASDAAAAAQPSGAAATSGTRSGASMSTMYKIEGISDDRLQTMVGKRVEVTGRVDDDDKREAVGTAGAATPKSADDDMPEFEATSIREVSGSCTPSQPRQ